MKAGGLISSTIHQTLTPEAAAVLNNSIAEASRRNHGQTTPLHVAAMLLSSPTGFLRQACIKSHPNSSHPLQCRALELCFSVALDRLPTSQNGVMEPPLSNALMAALKRSQAHQRRGCPEQQQQPLLAVKIELEQLVISILDDPSVSRVMREASFSSPAVKATIEKSLQIINSSNSSSVAIGFGFCPSVPVPVPVPVMPGMNRNSYVNPRLQHAGNLKVKQPRNEDVKHVADIMLKTRRRNPVLVGETDPKMVVKELFRRIESKEIGDEVLQNVEVLHLEKEFLEPGKVVEFGDLIETRIRNLNSGGVILDLGDLKWLVEHPTGFGASGHQQQVVSAAARVAVAEMGKLLERVGGGRRVWLIGTATCETYLRCQIYHPSMENDWDLQAVPIASRSPPPGMFSRIGSNGFLGTSLESLSTLKSLTNMTTPQRRFADNSNPAQGMSCCPECIQNYKQELMKVIPKKLDKSSLDTKLEAAQPQLPHWLKGVKSPDGDKETSDKSANNDQELMQKQKTLELQKKWNDLCSRIHPDHHQNNIGPGRNNQPACLTMNLHNQAPINCQAFQPKLNLRRNLGETVQPNLNMVLSQQSAEPHSHPGSPVTKELVLGRTEVNDTLLEKGNERLTKDFFSLVPSESQNNLPKLQNNKFPSTLDLDSFKSLLNGLVKKVGWQPDAASAVATAVTKCKLGYGKRSTTSKGDIWLLFTGTDRIGKNRMASALSNLVYGSNPEVVPLGFQRGDGREFNMNSGRKTALNRIAETVKMKPSSVIILEDFDEADLIVRGNIKRAMETGRLADSNGREISLGSIIFILTADWLPDQFKFLYKGGSIEAKKLANLANGCWQLRLSVREKTSKRRANWLQDKDSYTRLKRDTASALSFDLNEAANTEDDNTDSSHNSSDLTSDHEDELVHYNGLLTPATSPFPRDLLDSVDDHIVFKPIDFGPIRRCISDSILKKFSSIIGDRILIEIQEEALERITAGTWLDQSDFDEWSDRIFIPKLQQLKTHLPCNDSMVISLELDNGCSSWRSDCGMLPSSIQVNGIRRS